ncbi:MAG: hypothetical protein WCX27_02205 [Candidatus Paceibacterota bacterium]
MDIKRDFISQDPRDFKFKLGKTLASSLSGFIGGFVVASIFWLLWFTVPAMTASISATM